MTAAQRMDFDGDGVGDVSVVDPSGKVRWLKVEHGELVEQADGGPQKPATVQVMPAAAVTPIPISPCGANIQDRGVVGACIEASSTPALGHVLPLGQALFVSQTGEVGMGTTAPGEQLGVAGPIESLRGGFRFPDGTLQATATLPGPVGNTGPVGLKGEVGDPGDPGANGITSLNSQFGPALTIAGAGNATVTASGSTITVTGTKALCTYGSKTYSPNAACFTGGNEIPCTFGLQSIKLTCQTDGSWVSTTAVPCSNPSSGPVCGI